MKYFLDTNVIIDYLKGRPHIKAVVERLDITSPVDLAVNPVILVEVLSGMRPLESEATEGFLRHLTVHTLEAEDARLAAGFRQRYGVSHGVALPDALIAATAVRHRLKLVTQNTRHFPMPELTLHPL